MSDIHREAARLRGAARTAGVEARVRDAMRVIQEEMADNDGIYPANGGAVSMNEVARRAEISLTTLFAPKQKALGKIVKAWIESLREKEVVGRKRVQRTLAERSDAWRELFLALQDTHIATELDLQDTNVKLEGANAKLQEADQSLAELTEKYDALLEQLRAGAAGKVTSLPKRKK